MTEQPARPAMTMREIRIALGHKIEPDTQAPDRRHALAFNALGSAINHSGHWLPFTARQVAVNAVLDAIDADTRDAARQTGQQPGPTARALTPLEHDRAWHAIEGATGAEDADPGTVLAAVLHALRINPPTIEDEQAASPRRRATVDDPEVIAYRDNCRPNVLLCREHGNGWSGMTPLTADDLPGGGICAWGRPGPNECGRDVLIPVNEPDPTTTDDPTPLRWGLGDLPAPAAGLSDTQPAITRAAVLREAAELGRQLSRDGFSAQEIAARLDRMADEETSR
jgi:hypothetical protein